MASDNFSMSAFQRFSLCLDGFQHVSFSAFQLLPGRLSACQLFSISAFAWTAFSISAFGLAMSAFQLFSVYSRMVPWSVVNKWEVAGGAC
jgi:hypothetical protein